VQNIFKEVAVLYWVENCKQLWIDSAGSVFRRELKAQPSAGSAVDGIIVSYGLSQMKSH